jgi:hypothetical protein
VTATLRKSVITHPHSPAANATPLITHLALEEHSLAASHWNDAGCEEKKTPIITSNAHSRSSRPRPLIGGPCDATSARTHVVPGQTRMWLDGPPSGGSGATPVPRLKPRLGWTGACRGGRANQGSGLKAGRRQRGCIGVAVCVWRGMIWSVAVMACRGVMACEVQVCILHGQAAPGEGRDLGVG